ncbi:MAG: hypothetical protein OEV92_10145 [Nitrospinota bacterium]|nr:hypothetical protein [Nitrospinota bacterium]
MNKPIIGALALTGGGPTLHIPSVSFSSGRHSFGVSQAAYAEMERSFKRLSARSLLMASSEDSVILDRPADADYLALLRGCGAGGAWRMAPQTSAGLCLAQDAASCDETLGYIGRWQGPMEFYMPSPADRQLLIRAGMDPEGFPVDAAQLLNDKAFFIRTMEDMGLPQIESFAGNAHAVAARLDKDPGGPVIVRASASVGGAGAWVADGAAERLKLKKLVEKRHGEIFILQKWIPWVFSPNLQFYIGAESICLLGISAQDLADGVRHAGNHFGGFEEAGLDDALLEQGKSLALEAASLGYKGLLGVDFIVTPHGQTYAVELNARHNTSTHALWFANRFINGDPFIPARRGLTAYLKWPSDKGRLSAMEWMALLGPAAFDPDRGDGVLPYDCRSQGLEAVVIGADEERMRWLKAQAAMAAQGA